MVVRYTSWANGSTGTKSEGPDMKTKIIDSESLKRLKIDIVHNIEDAQHRGEAYHCEYESQRHGRQDIKRMDELEHQMAQWNLCRQTWHEALVKIEGAAKEIEI